MNYAVEEGDIATKPESNYLTDGTATMDIGEHRLRTVKGFQAEHITVLGFGVLLQPRSFRDLTQEWKRETRGISSVSEIFMHPAYQLIIGMGERALPDILHDLQQNGGEWFHALHSIVGRDIAAGTKTVSDARAAWIQWGYENNKI